jgi:hypothetical protein
MQLIQRFKLKSLNEIPDKLANFNHVFHLVKFFELKQQIEYDKKGRKFEWWDMTFLLKEKALSL